MWLLREKVIEQLHTYVHLVLPASFPGFSRAEGITVETSDADVVPLSPAELRALEFERSGRDPDAYANMVKLAKYFRGVLPVQEILWREGMREDTLDTVLTEFSRILVRSERPAPG